MPFFANNLYGDLGIAEIRATVVDYHVQIDPCCRNEDIFALTLFATIRGWFIYFFEGEERARILDGKCFLTSSYLKRVSF